MHAAPVLAMDIGGTKTAVALVRGAEVLRWEVVATRAAEGPDAVTASAAAAARRLLGASEEPPSALGVACAGVVTRGRVQAMSVDLMPGWHDFPLATRLEGALGLRVVALNDAQAAAFGEAVHGAGRGRGSVLFVTVSTGVGGGLVIDGRLWRGATGLAGHVGHVRGGLLERVASGTALARRARERGHDVGAREVIAAAGAGEAWATELLGDATRALWELLLDVKMLIDPELVVIGGGVGLNPGFQRALAAELDAAGSAQRIAVVPALLGADAGLVGAAAWALRELHGER